MASLYQKAISESTFAFSTKLIEKSNIMKSLKESGDQAAYESAKKDFDEFYRTNIERLSRTFKEPDRDITKVWDFGKEKRKMVFAENEKLYLTPLTDKYKNQYIQIKKELTVFKPEFYDNQEHADAAWNDTQTSYSLHMAVVRKADNMFLGYIGIKDTSCDIWEFVIEFLEQNCGQGYGRQSLVLFLHTISELTNKKIYLATVEVDNLRSQALMEKLGGIIVDIENIAFTSEDEAAAFEENHLDEITERMKEQALMLNIAPRKLLSHVLSYRLNVDDLLHKENEL